MSTKAKLLARMRRNQTNVQFNELKHLLELYGFRVVNNSGGSHYMVYFPGNDYPMRPIPNHGVVKPVYVRLAIQWIDQLQEGK